MKKIEMSRKEKKNLIRILTALALFIMLFTADRIIALEQICKGSFGWLLPFSLYLLVYLLIGYDVLWKAARNIAHGQIFDENFLMCFATLGAFSLGIYRGMSGQKTEGFDEACAVLLFYQIGEWFQTYATGKARTSISELMDIRPDYANIRRGSGWEQIAPDKVNAGDIIIVNPGEKVPLDGVVIKGETSLDTKALTGESLPRDVSSGEKVLSGCVNLTSQIEVKVTKSFYDSTVSKILDLVENASSQKSKAENFITKFAKYYTPAVVIAAVMIAVIPGLITSIWSVWIYRALSFLVVSCPCALVISIPLSFFAGIGAASRHGILVKGSNYLEKCNQANIFVFDKTGTLTKGTFTVLRASPENRRDEILRLAAIAEHGSSHPIARSIMAAYGKEAEQGWTLTNRAGMGIVAARGSDTICCGNERLMRQNGIQFAMESGAGTVVHVARNGTFIGSLLIADEIKEEAAHVIRELNEMGCKTVMLTGDNESIAKSVADQTGVTEFKASLLPQNKVEAVEALLKKKRQNDVLCFAGDGINDAPVLMRADIGIAMGGAGSDAAIEASDIVLMKDDLRGIPLAKRIARKTMLIVLQNIAFSISVKAAILLLSAAGITNMWFAVFGDVGVAVIAICNALRVNSRYEA